MTGNPYQLHPSIAEQVGSLIRELKLEIQILRDLTKTQNLEMRHKIEALQQEILHSFRSLEIQLALNKRISRLEQAHSQKNVK